MAAFARALLDLFFPPRCVYCDRVVERSAEEVCPRCASGIPWIPDDAPLVEGTHFAGCACAAWYRDELRRAFLGYKFHGRTEYAKSFGTALARTIALSFGEDFELLTWLPVSEERRRERGYDQSYLLAEAAAERLERPLTATLNKAHTKAQSGLEGVEARRRNVKDAFSVPEPALVRGRTVLLIDDLITSGSTLESACKALRAAGAQTISCACFARAAPEPLSAKEL